MPKRQKQRAPQCRCRNVRQPCPHERRGIAGRESSEPSVPDRKDRSVVRVPIPATHRVMPTMKGGSYENSTHGPLEALRKVDVAMLDGIGQREGYFEDHDTDHRNAKEDNRGEAQRKGKNQFPRMEPQRRRDTEVDCPHRPAQSLSLLRDAGRSRLSDPARRSAERPARRDEARRASVLRAP